MHLNNQAAYINLARYYYAVVVNSPEFQKALSLAKKNNATPFLEAAERYRP